MQKTKKLFRFDLKDAKFISEFPGILKCAAVCKNGIVTDRDLEDASQYKGQIGMCQVYKGNFGYFVVFFAEDLTIITTKQGIYTNHNNFHSVRADNSLFVFEEDFSKYEEAICIMFDVTKGFQLLEHKHILEEFLNSLNFRRTNFNDEDEVDED